MADEKKPKIDLKARLGKGAAGGATPPPPQAGGALPVPAPSAGNVAAGAGQITGNFGPGVVPAPTPTSPRVAGGLPVPPGIPIGPPPAFQQPAGMKLDPNNPLTAAMAQAQAPSRAKSIPPPQPQRIEVDELAVTEARKGARKQGIVIGVIFGVVLGAVGYIAGGAQETNKGRAQSVKDAKGLSADVQKSRDQLKAISDKVEAGRNTLGRDHKFPDTLAKDLSMVNVDFDGTKLAGVRFSGYSVETSSGLIEYITAVQSLNNRKEALVNLLNRLAKPLTEQIKAAADNKPPPVSFVALINRDSAKNPYVVLAPLQKPMDLSAAMPAEFLATDPISKQNVSAPKFASLDHPGAAYVVPKSIEAACPSETAGQIGQLVSQLSGVINDIQGEKPAPGAQDIVQDSKPGLLERADKLVTGLNKVQ